MELIEKIKKACEIAEVGGVGVMLKAEELRFLLNDRQEWIEASEEQKRFSVEREQALAEKIKRLETALIEIRDLARTGLPIDGYDEAGWNMLRLNRIAGMVTKLGIDSA